MKNQINKMDETKKQQCKTMLFNIVNTLAQSKVDKAQYVKMDRGIVKSISDDNKKAIVLINGYERTCKINPTYKISVGQVVRVVCENNDPNRLYISAISSEFYVPATGNSSGSSTSSSSNLNKIYQITNGIEAIKSNGVVTITFENISNTTNTICTLNNELLPHKDLTFANNGIQIYTNGEVKITKNITNDTITYVSKSK